MDYLLDALDEHNVLFMWCDDCFATIGTPSWETH